MALWKGGVGIDHFFIDSAGYVLNACLGLELVNRSRVILMFESYNMKAQLIPNIQVPCCSAPENGRKSGMLQTHTDFQSVY
jgi:hypothetical protein